MANANRLVEIQLNKIKAVINRGCKDILAQEIKDKLIEKIFDNFYDRYNVGDSGWLIDSITVKVEPMNNLNTFIVNVYFKDKPLRHTTWYGSDKLGISPNSKVYTVDWINSGWTYLPNGGGKRMYEDEGVRFLEATIDELQLDNSWIDKFYNYLRSNGIEIT